MYDTDLAFIHHDGFGEFATEAAPWLIATLRAQGIDRGLVVDAGCGSGITSRALAHEGYDVFGFDASPSMIRLAREHTEKARFEVTSFEDVDIPKCTAIFAIGEVLSYANGIEPFLQKASDALEPNGLLIFDVALRGIPLDDMHVRGEGWEVFSAKSLDPCGTFLTRTITTFRKIDGGARKSVEKHRIHLHDGEELKRRLREIGFAVTTRRSYGTAKLPPKRLAFIARKLLRPRA